MLLSIVPILSLPFPVNLRRERRNSTDMGDKSQGVQPVWIKFVNSIQENNSLVKSSF